MEISSLSDKMLLLGVVKVNRHKGCRDNLLSVLVGVHCFLNHATELILSDALVNSHHRLRVGLCVETLSSTYELENILCTHSLETEGSDSSKRLHVLFVFNSNYI